MALILIFKFSISATCARYITRLCFSNLLWTESLRICGTLAPRAQARVEKHATNFLMHSSREQITGGTDMPAKRRSLLTSGRLALASLLVIILKFGLIDTPSKWKSKGAVCRCRGRGESSLPAIIRSPSVSPQSPWYEMQSDDDFWNTISGCSPTPPPTVV